MDVSRRIFEENLPEIYPKSTEAAILNNSVVTDFDDANVNKNEVDMYPHNNEKEIITKKQSRDRNHPTDCRCPECVYMPLVRQLASTKEFFSVVEEPKLVYSMLPCTCPNSKKASKIPVAKGTKGPPGKDDCICGDVCKCRPCPDVDRQGTKAPKSDRADKKETDLSKLCDCGKCDCPICAKSKGVQKPCCCTQDCVCDQCKIEMMKKQIDKLKNDLNDLRGVSEKPDLGYPDGCTCDICNCPLPPGEDPRREQPEDCSCTVCDCPLAPGRAGDMSGCECQDCYCPKGPRFQKPTIKLPVDMTGCSCSPCLCPGGPLSIFPKCDCKKCECNPCSDPRRPKPVECDCDPCECSPCGDTKKEMRKWEVKCKCTDCQCSGLKSTDCTCLTCVCGKHPPGCTCPQCVCGREEKPPGCKCPVCACGTKFEEMSPACVCDKCKCGGPKRKESDVKKDEHEKKRMDFVRRSVSSHAINCGCPVCLCFQKASGGAKMCTCDPPCKCKECIFKVFKSDAHPPDCDCPKCKCKECQMSSGPTCRCPECICKPCKHITSGEKKRAEHCKCGDICSCKECVPKAPPPAPKGPKANLPKSRSCHCLECFCDACNNPAKKGADARPVLKIKGTEQKVKKKEEPFTPKEVAEDVSCKCEPCNCMDCMFFGARNPNCKCGKNCLCVPCEPAPAPAKKDAGTGSDKAAEKCQCKECHCPECEKKKKGDSGMPTRISCNCKECTCAICDKKDDKKGGDKKEEKKDAGPPCLCQVCKCPECEKAGDKKGDKKAGEKKAGDKKPLRIPCNCTDCLCAVCEKKGEKKGDKPAAKPGDNKCEPSCPGMEGKGGGGFEVPKRIPCQCKECKCAICDKKKDGGKGGADDPCGGLALRGGSGGLFLLPKLKESEPPPFEPPIRMPCTCNPCKCVMCNKMGGKKESAVSANPVTNSAEIQVQYKTQSTTSILPMYSCASCTSNTSLNESNGKECSCSLCAEKLSKINTKVGDVKSTHNVNIGVTLTTHSKSTSCGTASTKNAKVGESENRFGACRSVELNVLNFTDMDNTTLVKNIVDRSKESVFCKNQIQEIQSVLSNIKSVCSEVEEKAKKTSFIKQASTFGQTMSGLKLALNNLQEKCKAKDLLIEAMTGELRNRTNSISFLQVLDNFISGEAPDYDKCNDVVKTFDERKSKAVENERIMRKKKSSKTCKCGKIHRDKDYKMVDLKEFEIIDISRVTDDCVIVKWNPPKSDLVTGYDIFINGVNKSKVMSGGRTTAMIHSIDLSKTIQITIYAVTKCGICEPPAIAIYQI